ncbi:MAG: DUF3501 family protein [Acidimicrobiales bacterium]
MTSRRLALEDIEDLRQYERGRDEFRRRIIELKRRRRVAVGPMVTLVFENRETVRFQIQEMARAEKMVSDAQIQGELDVYNALIPEPGELSATLFVELTDEASLREWLVKLVGIERSMELRIGTGAGAAVVTAAPEAAHAEQLTRDDVTASVHYIRFPVGEKHACAFAAGPVELACVHRHYRHSAVLADDTRQELHADLQF